MTPDVPEQETDDVNRALRAARERESALRRILAIIRESRSDEQPVFDAILESACRLCGAPHAFLFLRNAADTHLEIAAHSGARTEFVKLFNETPQPLDARNSHAVRAVAENRVIQIEDLTRDAFSDDPSPQRRQAVDVEGMRTLLIVPLVTGERAIGAIMLYRREVDPFDDDDHALVATFAAQAVIAIENVRQFRELQTRLEREAATREILEVISRSRDDEQPVFGVILENAARLCQSTMARLHLLEDDGQHRRLAAHWGEDLRTLAVGEKMPMDQGHPISVSILEARVFHIEDISETDLYKGDDPLFRRLVDEEGLRTLLTVPLLRGGQAFGCIALSRRDCNPFVKQDIELVETFAAQAVIAIENVRQFRELQTRLERESATRGILEVISQSRDDEKPVFDAILESACRLCEASHAALNLCSEDRSRVDFVAGRGVRPDSERMYAENPLPMDPAQSDVARAILERRVIQIADLATGPVWASRQPNRVHSVEVEGMRTALFVPLMRGDEAIGTILLYRREVRPFDDRHVELVKTFAAQAVIAIENVRQFRELQTRLAREAATREILEVISRSRDDEQPVFDVILRNASHLCNSASAGLVLGREGDKAQVLAAHLNSHPEIPEIYADGKIPMDPELSNAAKAILEGRVIHLVDMADSESYRENHLRVRRMVDHHGVRTNLMVPLLSKDGGIGALILYKHEVSPYTDDQIALVETFAEQAVIAIENVRQFRAIQTANSELEARLEREAATREILQVISRSRDDEEPVFEAILENAARLCSAPLALLSVANEERSHVTVPVHRGLRPEFEAALTKFNEPIEGSDLVAVRAVSDGKVIRSANLLEDANYPSQSRWRTELVGVEGVRSIIVVPLLNRGLGVGAIILYRREVQPFSDDDLALIQAFAAQAVIAIENVRQFKALEARTRELNELNASLEVRVDEQVGEIERMGRLKRFLSPAVADAVVSSGDDTLLSSHRALIAILFADIRGFTAFCESAEPEEAIEVLQAYHRAMGALIADHGAGVDHRAGDGIMVIFNDPLPCDDPAGDALRLALAMRERMDGLCADWRKLGHRLGFGVGISLGYATVGMVGSEGRYDYTASGTAVNLASRLCDEAADGEILLSPRAFRAVEEAFEAEPAGELELKGFSAPVDVFRVVGTSA